MSAHMDSAGHDAFTDALATGRDIFDGEYLPPRRVDISRLEEVHGWLGGLSTADPQEEPYAEEKA